jgi:hypothetical protein
MVRALLIAAVVALVAPTQAGEPFVVYEGHADEIPKQPQAFVSASGITHLTFGIGNQVHYSNITGEDLTSPRIAFDVPNLSLGMRRGPRIADTGRSIVITAIGGREGKGKDGDLLSYRSEDKGKTWTGPVRVNDVESSAREGLHAMTSTQQGVLWCVWLDLRTKKTELYAAKSEDDGRSWSRNQLVYRSPGGSVCQCCHPSIIAVSGSLHILFRNSIDGNRDMYLVSSNDQGTSFEPAKRLGMQHWMLDGCPMDGGMLTADSLGKITTVWRSGGTIYTTGERLNTETRLLTGEQPWIASNSTGTTIVSTTARQGDLILSRLNSSEKERVAVDARDPIVVAGDGSNPFTYVFWEQYQNNRTTIMGKLIR